MTNPQTTPQQITRLNKYLAVSLGVSRRQADNLIASGQIKINDQIAKLGARIDSDDQVFYQNKRLQVNNYRYILFHKPIGYVCSRRQQGDTPTIYALLPQELHHLKTVGRLDRDSSGLIILTDDGDFTFQMTHPSFKKQKRYLVTLDNNLAPLHHQMINDFGVMLEDGKSSMFVSRQQEGNDKKWIVEMSEGKNRQIRRTFLALGYTVVRLHRTDFGSFTIGDLASGEYCEVSV